MNDTPQDSGSFICPSTKKYFQEWRTSSNSNSLWDFIHGYIYGRWPYTYISVAKGRHPLTKLLGPLFRIVSSLFPKTKADNGKIIWVADDMTLTNQPADSQFQRLEDWFLGILPIEDKM